MQSHCTIEEDINIDIILENWNKKSIAIDMSIDVTGWHALIGAKIERNCINVIVDVDGVNTIEQIASFFTYLTFYASPYSRIEKIIL